MEHEHKKGHKKGGRKKKHKHGNWSDDENKAADATENNTEPVFVPEETTEGGAIEIVDERRNSEVPADNQENSADCVVISDGAVEENAFEEENKAADATETNNEPVFVSEETTEEDAIEEENKAADATETNNEPVFVSEEITEGGAIEIGDERRNSEVSADNQENSVDGVVSLDGAVEENAFEEENKDEENKAADATETNTEPLPVPEETTEGGAIEIVDERCNSEVPADYEENGADPVHFEDENEQNYFEVPVYNQENSVDGVVSLDGAVEENAFEEENKDEENKAADATETNTEPLPVPEETTEGGAIEIVDERCNSEVPADYEENGADPVHFEDENEQNYFEVPVYNQDSPGRAESPNVSGISKKPGFNLKHSRSWDDNKLTEVRSALRQRGDIRRLVSQFESLAEDKVLESPIVKNGNSPSKFNASKNFSYIIPTLEQKSDVYGRSPPDYPTAGSSSSKVIDQMFAFVKSDDMQTPKSTLAIRQATSTPRRPLATSTPLFSSHSADRPLPSGDCGGNDERLYREKCQSLVREIAIQQQQASQAAEGIVICQKKHSFNGTIEELNAQRSLLVANERRLLLNQELDKLRERHALKKASTQKGWVKMPEIEMKGNCTVEITSIKVNLNRSYYIKSQDTDISFVFLALCKCGEQFYATQVQHCLDMGTMRSNAVQFRESMRFEHLPVDFALILEIYAFKIMSRDNSHGYSGVASKLASKAKAFMGSKKAVGNIFNNSEASGFQAHSDFYRCGTLRLNRDSVGKHHFCDNGAQYPLEGTVEVRASYVFAAM
ncbi:cell division protein anillin domain-containing protein [Ditylenchus destructor]|nr:cell division protein anillin domain-containing protein [Ditylenchus destructor]